MWGEKCSRVFLQLFLRTLQGLVLLQAQEKSENVLDSLL